MARPAPHLDEETITVPATVHFPVELHPPPGFDPDDLATWPQVDGRLEWVGGRLLWIPPCGTRQQVTVADVVFVLTGWVRRHPEYVAGTNEAGMALGDDKRGADGAVWRRDALVPTDPGFARVPPVLAVEVAGREEREPALRDKARWYLQHGVAVVWLVLPESREVVVVTAQGDRRYRRGETLAPHPALPDLTPRVDELFVQLGS